MSSSGSYELPDIPYYRDDDDRGRDKDGQGTGDQRETANSDIRPGPSRTRQGSGRKRQRQESASETQTQESVREQRRPTKTRHLSEEQLEARRAKEREKKANQRRRRSEEEHVIAKERNRKHAADYRQRQSQELQQQHRDDMRQRMRDRTAGQTQEQQQQHRDDMRQRMVITRRNKATKIKDKDALKSHEIMSGIFPVLSLEETDDNIGEMTSECCHCGALKFKKETPSVCCSSGKVGLTPFPRPPQPLLDLWLGTDTRSRLLREHARTINNAVCLSSISVAEKHHRGFNPSVIFQGKLSHRAGSIRHAEGEHPVFAQLYVLDASLESTTR